jgi:hypothetical protein
MFCFGLVQGRCLSIGKRMDEYFAHFLSKRSQLGRQVKQWTFIPLRVHQASAMLWRKDPKKPSSARLNNKVCMVPFKVLPFVAISFPLPLLVSEETSSPPDDVQLNHKGVPHLYPRNKPWATEIPKDTGRVFLSFLMSLGKFSIIFLSKYTTLNLVRMLLLLSDFSAFVLGLNVGFLLYKQKKNKTPKPPPPSPSTVKKIKIKSRCTFCLVFAVRSVAGRWVSTDPSPHNQFVKKLTPYPLRNEKNISRKPY